MMGRRTQVFAATAVVLLAFSLEARGAEELLAKAISAPVTAPVKGEEIADPSTGCRVWNPNPEPKETVRWTGSCVNGVIQGRGILQWFKDGKPNGHYDGELRDGRHHGRGVFTWISGDRHDGDWRDGKPNGSGTYTVSDGTTFTGTWTNGCFQKGERRAWVSATKEECGWASDTVGLAESPIKR